jgi:hypothetical protein
MRRQTKSTPRPQNPLPGEPDEWIDKGTYWLSVHPQTSPPWHAIKEKAYLITASRFGTAAGLETKYRTADDIADVISGLRKPPPVPQRNQEKMARGVVKEPFARDWYCQTRQVQVDEVGLAIPKWYPRIGCSLDGEVIGPNGEKDGMIEIKCPDVMPGPIVEHQERLSAGWIPPPFYHAHIPTEYYCQMQGCMAICVKKWCDYIVFITDTQQAYVERVYFNQKFWEDELFPRLCHFITQILDPKIALAKDLKARTGSSLLPPEMDPNRPIEPINFTIPVLAITADPIASNSVITVESAAPTVSTASPSSPVSTILPPLTVPSMSPPVSSNPVDPSVPPSSTPATLAPSSVDRGDETDAKVIQTSSTWLQRRLAQMKKS